MSTLALGLILILPALTFTPVNCTAPAREVSILIGTFFGAKLLKEADARRRLLAAAGMVAGVVALAGMMQLKRQTPLKSHALEPLLRTGCWACAGKAGPEDRFHPLQLHEPALALC